MRSVKRAAQKFFTPILKVFKEGVECYTIGCSSCEDEAKLIAQEKSLLAMGGIK